MTTDTKLDEEPKPDDTTGDPRPAPRGAARTVVPVVKRTPDEYAAPPYVHYGAPDD